MLFLDHFNIESGSLHTAYVKRQERNQRKERGSQVFDHIVHTFFFPSSLY